MEELRWGVLGCGRIAGDFVKAMQKCLSNNKIIAVASVTSLANAHDFCRRNLTNVNSLKIRCYNTYEELLNQLDIDIVYVSVLNHQHKNLVLKALQAGKHVLCEKPLGINRREVFEMVEMARRQKLFLMEAYWSRLFPVWQEIRSKKLQKIGDPNWMQCDFGFFVERVVAKQQENNGGEGYLLATGVYPIMLAQFVFGDVKPKKITAIGGSNENGMNEWANITLEYNNNRIATLFYSGKHTTPRSATISGIKGYVQIPNYFWCPTEIITKLNADDRNAQADSQKSFPLPEHDGNKYFFPRSVGLCYEIDHVFQCISNGLTESDQMKLNDSIIIAEILDEIRYQLNIIYPQDKV